MSKLKFDSLEDLQRTLIRQREYSEKVKRELARVTDSVTILYAPDGSYSALTTKEVAQKISNMLASYATLPTLSEFEEKPSLHTTAVWGGSFGVSVIVGTVILKSLTDLADFPPKVIKMTFLKVLKEMHRAFEGVDSKISIMERVMENLTFSIKDSGGKEIVGEQRNVIIKRRVSFLLEIMAKMMEDYGLIQSDHGGENISSSLTSIGHRVYCHIKDVEMFIEQVGETYKQLAEKKKSEIPGVK